MTTLWVRDPATLWRETAGGVVLLPPGEQEVLALTDSGAALWELLEAPTRLDAAAARLAEAYGVAADIVLEGIRPLLADLEGRNAVCHMP